MVYTITVAASEGEDERKELVLKTEKQSIAKAAWLLFVANGMECTIERVTTSKVEFKK